MEFPLDFVYYLYNYYMVCVLLSHTPSCDCDLCDTYDMTLSHTPSCIVSSKVKVKEKKYK